MKNSHELSSGIANENTFMTNLGWRDMLKDSNSDDLSDLKVSKTAAHSDVAIKEPTATDVLLGRGVSTNRHPGNINFRSIVASHVVSYVHMQILSVIANEASVLRSIGSQQLIAIVI